ncbi:hypothetical protein FF011L_03020 [Roseimaritima multifibrata]|uniref:Uncharacterized protein n=1 Tax=Roseimaritima multifibrata TaxID=1930274 RepID=A0A517M9L2_9BACT|nr:hypothetical protein FF011L_03020 [Roseimaritima multifibrata]
MIVREQLRCDSKPVGNSSDAPSQPPITTRRAIVSEKQLDTIADALKRGLRDNEAALNSDDPTAVWHTSQQAIKLSQQSNRNF